jgi:hypothetical protein
MVGFPLLSRAPPFRRRRRKPLNPIRGAGAGGAGFHHSAGGRKPWNLPPRLAFVKWPNKAEAAAREGFSNGSNIPPPSANSVAVAVIVALLAAPAAAMGLSYLMWDSPYATDQYLTRSQPVPFSHAHHVGDLGLDCRMCHTGVEKAVFAGLPSTHICMTCHSQIWTNASMLEPVRASLASGQPLHWTRVTGFRTMCSSTTASMLPRASAVPPVMGGWTRWR